jgi:hypothetical protein
MAELAKGLPVSLWSAAGSLWHHSARWLLAERAHGPQARIATLNAAHPNPEKTRRWSWLKAALYGGLAGAVLGIGVQVANIVFWNNFHTLVPGRFYRCSQVKEADLERLVGGYGIRTVVNLRGICFGCDFYYDECRATHRFNVSQEDVGLSAGRLPPSSELSLLIRALDQSEQPVLIHCRQGVDRTGLVSAIVLLLYTDADVKKARDELSLRYGHVALGRTAYMSRFFDLYEEWLAKKQLVHSRDVFRRWVEKEYCPGPDRAEIELVEVPSWVPLGQPWSARVRLCNTSVKTWHFRPGGTAGIHCGYILTDVQGNLIVRSKAGLFNADVPPGESIELTLALPSVTVAGTYYLMADMLDEQQQSWFYQHGSKPLVRELWIGPEDRRSEQNTTWWVDCTDPESVP